jgi:uncharacterized protein YceK
MKKLFLLLLIVALGFSGCKTLGSQNDPLQRLVEQGKQNLSVQKPSNNTQNPPQTNVPKVSVVSPESQDVLPVTKTFTDKYGDMYVITVEKFEKNIQVSNEWLKPQEGAAIVGILVKVENKGKHFKWFMCANFVLKDSTGYHYGCRVLGDNSRKELTCNLVPGEKGEGWIFFEVPKTVLDGPFTLVYDTGEFDENFNYKTLQFTLR